MKHRAYPLFNVRGTIYFVWCKLTGKIVHSNEVCAMCGTTDEFPDGNCAYCTRKIGW